jgi:hypothetical protein
MPNWWISADYRFPRDFPAHRWAWEFLRRNPGYRKAWDDALSRFLTRTGEFQTIPIVKEYYDNRVCVTAMPVTDPADPDFYIPIRAKNAWFLDYGLLNPSTDAPTRLAFSLSYGRVAYFPENREQLLSPAGLRYPWAVFDLTLPLQIQVKSVLETLCREQKRQGITPRRVTC